MQLSRTRVYVLVGFLGFVAGVLGIAAEVTRIKADEVSHVGHECHYPSTPAFLLGLFAALLLLIAQIIANASGGCICCCRKNALLSGTSKCFAIVCFVSSWVTFVAAFLIFLAGAALNSQREMEDKEPDGCIVIRPGSFVGGAGLAFCTVGFSLLYYSLVTSGTSVAVGQPAVFNSQSQVPLYHQSQLSESSFAQVAYAPNLEISKVA